MSEVLVSLPVNQISGCYMFWSVWTDWTVSVFHNALTHNVFLACLQLPGPGWKRRDATNEPSTCEEETKPNPPGSLGGKSQNRPAGLEAGQGWAFQDSGCWLKRRGGQVYLLDMYILATGSEWYLVQPWLAIGQRTGMSPSHLQCSPRKKIPQVKTSLKLSPLCTVQPRHFNQSLFDYLLVYLCLDNFFF